MNSERDELTDDDLFYFMCHPEDATHDDIEEMALRAMGTKKLSEWERLP